MNKKKASAGSALDGHAAPAAEKAEDAAAHIEKPVQTRKPARLAKKLRSKTAHRSSAQGLQRAYPSDALADLAAIFAEPLDAPISIERPSEAQIEATERS
jgi:hypothetical protein